MANKTTRTTGTAKATSAATRAQKFYYKAQDANSVMLAGDFTHWQRECVPLTRGPEGVWQATVMLPPGTHHYRFIVDGEWRDDPECTLRVANGLGGENCVRRNL